MRRPQPIFALFGVLLLSLGSTACDEASSIDRQLAFHHAPILYQDTHEADHEADFLAAVDYDNNFRADDNWDNFEDFETKLAAAVYYSVVETEEHWYIVYGLFHPRDWAEPFGNEHENDLEGMLAIVRKDGSTFGTLEGVITVFHNHFFSYTPTGSPLTDGEEDIDGELTMDDDKEGLHPRLTQEAQGHGVKAWPFAGGFFGRESEDGVIYRPASAPDTSDTIPASGNDRDALYGLKGLFVSLWPIQRGASLPRSEAETWAKWGTFKGDESGGCGAGLTVSCSEDAAHAPWGWDDEDDGPVFAGELALDPLHVADFYFDGIDGSVDYVRNRYLSDLRADGYGPGNVPPGWPSQLDMAALLAKAP